MKGLCLGCEQVFGSEMIRVPSMIMVGAGNRNAGKTEFACSLIRKFASLHDIIAIKVTAIEDSGSGCPRGKAGCGVCVTLRDNYCIIEETNSQSDKDTCRMLASGAVRVFWLRALRSHLAEAMTALQDIIGGDVISVCESNSLRRVVEPGLFFMLENCKSKGYKASAKEVAGYADRTLVFDGYNFNISLDEIKLVDGRWADKMQVTAIIMAGGRSRRMGREKSMLAIAGEPAIKHIFEQLQPHFSQVLVSSNDAARYGFLSVKVVADEVTGKGPLMGIASALKASANEVNFVIACDIPEVDISFVRRMVRQSRAVDAVVPITGVSRYEPLFAVYKKSALGAIERAIASGNYRIIDALSDCRVDYMELENGQQLTNLNTMNDYHEFCRKNK